MTLNEKIRTYAFLYNIEVVEVIVDAGTADPRLPAPGLDRALDMLRRRAANALVVLKLDRLTCSVRNLGHLVDRHFADGRAALLSVSERVDTRTAAGRLVLNVLGSVSQWEWGAIGERTSTAMRYKATAGEFTGGEPKYGYRLAAHGVHLVAVRSERAIIIEEATALRASGLSFRAVARQLNARGRRRRTGKPFVHVQVRRILDDAGAGAIPGLTFPATEQSRNRSIVNAEIGAS